MEFSNDGSWLLILTIENYLYILNALTGGIKHLIRDFQNENGKVTATFSSCSKYVLVGDEKSNGIAIFETSSGRRIHELKGHPKTPGCMAWSPEHILLVTACNNVLFWVPDMSRLTTR